MSILAELSIFPIGKDESLSPYVARCVKEIRGSGLTHELHAMGTLIQAERFDEVADVIRRCLDQLADCDRVYLTLKLDCRKGHDDPLAEKVASIKREIDGD